MKITITPLESSPIWATIIQFGNIFKILVDCGWQFDQNPTALEKYLNYLSDIDIILISHPSLDYIGALPYLYKNFKCNKIINKKNLNLGEELINNNNLKNSSEKGTIPIISTHPVFRLGYFAISDAYEHYTSCRSFIHYNKEDINQVFNICTRIRYNENYVFIVKGQKCSIKPIPAGHSIGGSIWSINISGRTIIYGVGHNCTPQWPIPGAAFSEIINPALFITDIYERPNDSEHIKIPQLRNTIRNISKVLKSRGSVLIPVDADACFLELLVHLEIFWKQNSDFMNSFPIIFLSPVGGSLFLSTKTMIEWMNEKIRQCFANSRFNPLDNFDHIIIIHDIKELEEYNDIPKVIFSTPCSLSLGFSNILFQEMAPKKENLILFYTKPPKNSLGHKLLNLFNSDASNQFHFNNYKIEHTEYKKILLTDDTSLNIFNNNTFNNHDITDLNQNLEKTALEIEDLKNISKNSNQIISDKFSDGNIFNATFSKEKKQEVDHYLPSYNESQANIISTKLPINPFYQNMSHYNLNDTNSGVLQNSTVYSKTKYGDSLKDEELLNWKNNEDVIGNIFNLSDNLKHKKVIFEKNFESPSTNLQINSNEKLPFFQLSDLSIGASKKQKKKLNEYFQSSFQRDISNSQNSNSSPEDENEINLDEKFYQGLKLDESSSSFDSSDEDKEILNDEDSQSIIINNKNFRSFQYIEQKIDITLNCNISVYLGLERMTSEKLLKMNLIHIKPRQVCLLPSCLPSSIELFASYLRNSQIPIQKIHTFFKEKIDLKSKLLTNIENCLNYLEIELPYVELILKLDDNLWKEFMWSCKSISDKVEQDKKLIPFNYSKNSFASILIAQVEKNKSFINLQNENNLIQETDENILVQDTNEESSNPLFYNDRFWTPTSLKANFNVKSFDTESQLQMETDELMKQLNETWSQMKDSSLIHSTFQTSRSIIPETLLIGNIAMKNVANDLLKALPGQTLYAPQGGILTISNSVALCKKVNKEETVWEIEGSLDPAYYFVRKLLLQQFSKLQRDL